MFSFALRVFLIILVVTCDNCEHTWTLCHKSQLRQIIGKEGKNKKWNDNPNNTLFKTSLLSTEVSRMERQRRQKNKLKNFLIYSHN